MRSLASNDLDKGIIEQLVWSNKAALQLEFAEVTDVTSCSLQLETCYFYMAQTNFSILACVLRNSRFLEIKFSWQAK